MTHLKHESFRLKVARSFTGATGLFPFTNVDATNLNCRCVPAYRYVCWLTWVYPTRCAGRSRWRSRTRTRVI